MPPYFGGVSRPKICIFLIVVTNLLISGAFHTPAFPQGPTQNITVSCQSPLLESAVLFKKRERYWTDIIGQERGLQDLHQIYVLKSIKLN